MNTNRRLLFPVLLLVVVGSAILFSASNQSLLYRYDDAFFAATARQVAEQGNWLDLELRGTPVLEKPPLTFWFEALSIRMLGASSAAARVPGSLLFLGMTLVLWAWMRRWRGEREALISALVILTSHQLIFYARRPVNEIYIVVWAWMVAVCYLQILARGGTWPRLLAGVFLGLAFMTKGIMGLLPIGPIVLHALVERDFRRVFFHRGTLYAAAAFLVIVVPWHVRMVGAYGDDFRRIYLWQTQLSFLTGTTHSDPWSIDVIARKVAETWWPWLLPFVIALATSIPSLWKRKESEPGRIADRTWLRFLWIWFGLTFVVFHLVYVKRDRYVLPVYPAMAMLASWWICRVRWLPGTVVVIAVGFAGFALLSPNWPLVVDNDRFGDRTGALVSILESDASGPVLVYEHPGDYCFDCDTFAYFNGVQAQPYSEDQLRTWLVEGPVRVYGLRRYFDRDWYEVPAGIEFTTLYADERAAVFEARTLEGTPAHRVGWPEPTSPWPGSRGFEVRRKFREHAAR